MVWRPMIRVMCSLHLNTSITRGCGCSVFTWLAAKPVMLRVGIFDCRLLGLSSGIGTMRVAVRPIGIGVSYRRMNINWVFATHVGRTVDTTLTIRFWSRVLLIIEQPG